MKQADIDDGHRERLTSARLDELAQLREENRVFARRARPLERVTVSLGRETR